MIAEQLKHFWSELKPFNATLIPVSKTMPNEKIIEAYEAGNRIFGENKVQELISKQVELPDDIEWHYIGHLQSNKVKYIAPFVSMIHAVDSLKLLNTINKEGIKNNRVIKCLLQMHIASEESKFGLTADGILEIINNADWANLTHVNVVGLMGMATFTENKEQVREEFKKLAGIKKKLSGQVLPANVKMSELSMGMTNDYKLALEEGTTMVRIGTAIFGPRACMIDG